MTTLETYRSLHARYVALFSRGECRYDDPQLLDLASRLDVAWEQLGFDDRIVLCLEFARATETRAEILDPETPCLAGAWAEAVVRATAEAEGSVVSEGGQCGDVSRMVSEGCPHGHD